MFISRRVLILVIASLFLLLGSFLFWYLSPNQVVKRQLKSFLQSVTFQEDQSSIVRSFKTDRFVSHLSKTVEIQAPIEAINQSFSASTMRSGHNYLVTQAKFIKLDYDTILVSSLTTTEAKLRISLKLDAAVKSEPRHSMQLLGVFRLKKQDDGWKINSIHLKEK